jgi:hypothetical protein
VGVQVALGKLKALGKQRSGPVELPHGHWRPGLEGEVVDRDAPRQCQLFLQVNLSFLNRIQKLEKEGAKPSCCRSDGPWIVYVQGDDFTGSLGQCALDG